MPFKAKEQIPKKIIILISYKLAAAIKVIGILEINFYLI